MTSFTSTVFIVDDEAEFRQALARLLQSAEYDVQTFASSLEFLTAHDPRLPGCLILDLAMPDMDGLQVQAALRESDCNRPIIFLSGNGCIESSVSAMRGGAVTFLTKPIERRVLFAAVEEALRIDAVQCASRVVQQEVLRRLDSLTRREREVLSHVIAGRLNKQIAADLGTVVKTIKVHRARVMHKMGVRSVAHLSRLAASAGIELPMSEVVKTGRINTGSVGSTTRSDRKPRSEPRFFNREDAASLSHEAFLSRSVMEPCHECQSPRIPKNNSPEFSVRHWAKG
jgi:FixJ family two-component response regulator